MVAETTIPVSNAVADELYRLKQRGETYDDVLRRELDLTDSPAAGDDSEPSSRDSAGVVTHARDALAGWDPDNTDSDAARAATVAVVEWLASEGGFRPKREIEAWLADAPVAEGYSQSTVWRKLVVPGLRELRERGVVEQVRNKGWRVVEE